MIGGSKITALVRALVISGATPEIILAAVEASESEAEAAIERRRASDRERQERRRHVMSRDVTVTERDTPVSDKEKSPTPPKEINSTPNSSLRSEARKRAHRMPDDFMPDIEYAISEGMTRSAALSEVERMRDWSKSSPNGAKLDWPATWRGWVKRRMSEQPRSQQQQPLRKTAFQQQQDEARKTIDDFLGITRHDNSSRDGAIIELDQGNWRAH